MARQEYSDEFKADALALLSANDGNVKRTAGMLGMPHSTLHNWQNGRGVSEDVSELGNKKKGVLADKIEKIAERLVDHLVEKDMDQASWSQLTTALGISVDKMRLLREEATSIDEQRHSQVIKIGEEEIVF